MENEVCIFMNNISELSREMLDIRLIINILDNLHLLLKRPQSSSSC